MDFKRQVLAMALIGLAGLGLRAEVVHVVEQVKAGETLVIRDSLVDTGVAFRSSAAPTVPGHIFTHWSISTVQSFRTGGQTKSFRVFRFNDFASNAQM